MEIQAYSYLCGYLQAKMEAVATNCSFSGAAEG